MSRGTASRENEDPDTSKKSVLRASDISEQYQSNVDQARGSTDKTVDLRDLLKAQVETSEQLRNESGKGCLEGQHLKNTEIRTLRGKSVSRASDVSKPIERQSTSREHK